MNDNVASFEDFDSDLQIAAHQSGLVRVILEGRSDVELFDRYWFTTMRESFEFIEASRLTGGSGCSAVREAVLKSQQTDQVPALGIVDRDSLFRDSRWDLLFSVDDAAFEEGARTPELYVTSRWEVEAYMLEPDLLPHWVHSSHKPPPGSQADGAAALDKALRECEVLLDASSFFAAMHVEGKACNDNYFRGQSMADVQQACALQIAALSPGGQMVAKTVQVLIAEVRANLPAAGEARLLFFLRYVDTKRLLIRLFQALNLTENSHWTLPNFQLFRNQKPAELEGRLRAFETKHST